MTDLSLRWRILLFFCLLGLLPQVAISYFSEDAYTRSLEETYNNQVTQLVAQAAEQTSVRTQYLVNELRNQATQPYLQLSFQQYPQNTRLQLLRERLELFRSSGGAYTRLNLCYLDGERMVSTATTGDTPEYIAFEKNVISTINDGLQLVNPQIYRSGHELAFFVPVYSFRLSSKIVGFMVAYFPLKNLTLYLEKLDFGEHAKKSIVTSLGEVVKTFKVNEHSGLPSMMRRYSANVETLNWQIVVSMSEEELFSDVNRLKRKNMLFIGSIIVVTFGAIFVFSYKFTRPFKQIIAGTKTYATGNLEHRITVESGHEAKQLAAAFNDMACQLNDRQMELNQAVRLASLGVMTAGIGHEIKNPLTGIKTSSQVINRILCSEDFPVDTSGMSPEQAESFVEVAELATGISEEADRLTKILNDLLEFGRPRKPRSAVFDISETVTHAVSLVRAEFNKKDVKTGVQVMSCPVFADSDQILQVLLNLLLNGLEAVSSHTGLVQVISDQPEGGAVILRIKDNGTGIASDKLQHIFDPFFSLREDGTGLGLSVVYTLLKRNGASLKVSSKLNQGTEFEITFANSQNAAEDMIND